MAVVVAMEAVSEAARVAGVKMGVVEAVTVEVARVV